MSAPYMGQPARDHMNMPQVPPVYPQQGGQAGYPPQSSGYYPQSHPVAPTKSQGGQPEFGAPRPPIYPGQQMSALTGGGTYPGHQHSSAAYPPQMAPPQSGYGHSAASPAQNNQVPSAQGSYGQGPSPPYNYGQAQQPAASYSQGPSPPYNYGQAQPPAASYSQGPSPPYNYGQAQQPPASYSQGPNPYGNYGQAASPPGNYGQAASPAAPARPLPQSGYSPGASQQGPPPPAGAYGTTGTQPQSGGYPAAATVPSGGYGPPGGYGAPAQQNAYNTGSLSAANGQAGVPAHSTARPGQEYVSKVELRLQCRNLLNKDVLSKSDPCAVLYRFHNGSGRYEEVGRTENVKNNLNPNFTRSFVMDYFFEEVEKVMIAVYDIDNITPQLTDDDFLGQVETTLGQLVSNSPFTKPLVLRNGLRAGNGTITIQAEELKEGTEIVYMNFGARKLDKKDFLGKSDPYLEVLKAVPGGSWQVIHRTEVVKNNLNPSWRPFELRMSTMCGGNKQQQIKFDVYDWDSDGTQDYIGGFVTTIEEMMKAEKQEMSWPCINPTKKAKKKGYQNSGIVLLTSFKLTKPYTFLDFIFGGMEISFTVGIDFTGSNGHPSKPTSLHYIHPQQPNEYMQAIRAVGDVCQDYDTDKMFPALGFGAKIPPSEEVLHEFAINFNPQNPYCAGIDGVLQAYYNCIQRVQLYGPTNAAPIINHVARFAAVAQNEEPQKGAHAYYILLMLTDGVLSDMSNTKQAIVMASRLPMSIIIVGVGSADFTDMNVLDGDNGVLRAPNGEVAKRDIVQFVPFRDFKRSSPAELARFVLAEVPKQVTDYYKMRNIQPKKRPQVS